MKTIIYKGLEYRSLQALGNAIGRAGQSIGKSIKLGHKINGSYDYKLKK